MPVRDGNIDVGFHLPPIGAAVWGMTVAATSIARLEARAVVCHLFTE
jgi:hypothetical protein